jgi:hypothetical protein
MTATLTRWLAGGLLLALALAAMAAAITAGVLGQGTADGCLAGAATGGTGSRGVASAQLRLLPGRWYQVGATEYGGPGDPTSGAYGSVPDPAQAYQPAHPDTFAELSVLPANPASNGTFTFADANALGNLPYLTGLRVQHDGAELVLYKRDIGYGQGPGQKIANGQPYRLDVWWQAAQTLGVTKTAVSIQLAPATGAAATLEQLPGQQQATGENLCEAAAGEQPLLAPGLATRILPTGLAAAGEQAPPAVQAMVAAGNRLHDAGYEYGAGHGPSLDTLQAAYDCSSAVSYLLHAAGLLGSAALDSTELERYGQPGPGRFVTVYANAAHAFVYVAGLRLDTVEDPAYDAGPNAGRPGPRWRVYTGVPNWAAWVERHPSGL